MDEKRENAEKPEIYVSNKRFPKSLDEEGLIDEIHSSLEGCSFQHLGDRWEGDVNMGSGDINITVYDKCAADEVRVELDYGEKVIMRHLSKVRGVLGNIGFAKKIDR